jgi:hypothetical protein
LSLQTTWNKPLPEKSGQAVTPDSYRGRGVESVIPKNCSLPY